MDYFNLLIDNKFYSQRRPNSKIIVYNLKKEKIDTIENLPENIEKILESFEKQEKYPFLFFDYKETDDGIKITKIKSDAGRFVKIPEKIEDLLVTEIGTKVLKDAGMVEQIILPETIMELDKEAFYNSIYLRSINIPKSITTIPANCFSFCGKLFDVNLSHVKEIEYNAFNGTLLQSIDLRSIEILASRVFENCMLLKDIKLPSSLQVLPKKIFGNCSSLEHIILPDELINFESAAFGGYYNLSEIILPKKVKSIGSFCFDSCKKIKEFIAPESLEEIKHGAFVNTGIETIKLNKNLKKVEEGAFKNCTEIKTAEIYSETEAVLTEVFDFDKVDKIKYKHQNTKEQEEIIEK